MKQLFDILLYDPLLNSLVFLYQTISFHDLGVAIVLITIFIRIILYPVFHKMAKNQTVMQRLQPELKKIQELHKKDKEKHVQATMDLYKKHEINPFSNIFLVIIQIPILIALFNILNDILKSNFSSHIYSFITPPDVINITSLGLINLNERSIVMVVLVALAQYIQAQMSLPALPRDREATQQEKIGRQMVFIGPVLTLIFFYNFPAAIALYWLISTAFSILQQYIVNEHIQKNGTVGTNSQKNS
ncbi:MAG: YidC/Oxa1 family membrane protein insertase [Patescibacteria group bacterium]